MMNSAVTRLETGGKLSKKKGAQMANAYISQSPHREGSWEGGGVLLTRATASFLVEDTTFTMMEIAPSCGVIYGI